MRQHIQVVAFDADDTLWVNEPHYREVERRFCQLLEHFLPFEELSPQLLQIEVGNLPVYGYGVKGFTLSMLETIDRVSNGTAPLELVRQTIAFGKELLTMPVQLLDGVEETLENLKSHDYRLVVATKGDLLDQERKLRESGLSHYFHHIEIMSDKRPANYEKLLHRLDCVPDRFLMLGNSMKSDVLPVLGIDGWAAHIPFHTTWEHEQVDTRPDHARFLELNALPEILQHLGA